MSALPDDPPSRAAAGGPAEPVPPAGAGGARAAGGTDGTAAPTDAVAANGMPADRLPAAGAVPGGVAGDGAVPGGVAADDAGEGGAAAAGAPAAAVGEGGGVSRREHAIRGTLAAALCLEALTVLFVPQTVARVGDGGLTGAWLALLLGLAAALFVTAGLQRSRAGVVIGTVLQLAVIATGVLVAAMYFLGLLFAGVWTYLLWVRQELTRAARSSAAP